MSVYGVLPNKPPWALRNYDKKQNYMIKNTNKNHFQSENKYESNANVHLLL